MPASRSEVDEVEKEGVKIHILATPTNVLTKSGRVAGLQCIRMKLGKPDDSGRRRPTPVTGSEFDVDVDNVIIAIGQAVDKSRLPAELNYTTEGTVAADPATLETNIGGVFAGGDIATGPATVTEAIGAGKRAAISIDRYLRNKSLHVKERKRSVVGLEEVNLTNTPVKHRAKVSVLPAARRLQGFAEIEGGFTADVAADEAQRCLACASFKERCAALLHCPAIIRDIDGNTAIDSFLCNGCGVCADICPYGAIIKKEEV
jgi:NADPH-dependent glutamate synthase beta subunit-like oxidoreductase